MRLRHGKDAAHAAAPLLRQMQLTEHAGDHWVADAFFLGQRVGHSDNMPRIVHANDELAASGIGKRHQGFEQVARRRQVALEFQLLASGLEPQGHVGTHGVHGASAALVRTSRARNSATLMKLRSHPMRCAAGWFKVCAVKRKARGAACALAGPPAWRSSW